MGKVQVKFPKRILTMANFEEKTKAFEQFLDNKGIKLSEKVELADFRAQNQGRGMIATQDIEEGETLFTIPPQALLRFEFDNALMELVKKYELDSWSALIVKMMTSYNDPEWKPYFDILPTEFNTPMFWPDSEIKQLLQGSEVIDKIDKEGANSLYDDLANGVLKENYFSGANTSRENFHRMGSLIMAYGFDVPVLGNAQGIENGKNSEDEEEEEEDEDDDDEVEVEGKAMIAAADILNAHTKLHNSRLTIPETEEEEFEMVASKPIAKGEQIYNNYGNLPSCDMLRRYGFVEAGGTNFEVVELSDETVVKTLSKHFNKTEKEVGKLIDSRVNKYYELPESYVFSITAEGEEGVNVEIDPDLILMLNCVTAKLDSGESKFSRKNFSQQAKISENETLNPDAAALLQEIITDRKQLYKQPIPSPDSSKLNEKTQVYLSKEDMAAQLLQSESMVLGLADDWAASFQDGTRKKQKV